MKTSTPYRRSFFAAGLRTIVALAAAFTLIGCAPSSGQAQKTEDFVMKRVSQTSELATLGGGCFWCVEAVYERMDGILAAVSGYAGGTVPDPTYQQVTGGRTGHAEVVQLEYDPAVISYEQILEIFWRAHDPTTKDRQGADVGPHYRSIILYHDDVQREIAEMSRDAADASGDFPNRIVTEIVPLQAFYAAEGYHQDYYEKNPEAGYCQIVINPKLQKLGLDTESLYETRK